MKCRIILELLAILFFTGCYNREQISRLDEAEALIQNKPDSALTILQQLKSEGSQAEQARYALLYSEALDKNHIKATNDSLIRRAWEYYKHHPKDLRRQCKTLYYWGKVKLRAGDKPGALRLYLKVEEKLKDTNEPYYAGLLYSQIGEVYYDQMNYSRAYHYFREARNNFRQSDNTREETEATLDMAAATFNSKDMEKAMRLYSAALDLADEHKFDKLAKASLTNLASLYVVSGKKQIPHDLLQRIELSARQDTLYGYHTLVDANLLKNRIDSARYYLALAEAHSTDIRDIADLQYTAYRIEAQARNFEKATEKIHHYIYLTDSLTRSNMQFSAGMVERDYFKERSNFAEYRMKNRTIWEIAVASVIFLILGVAYYIIRQRLRLQRERTDHYLLLAEEANFQYKTLTEHMEGQRNAESHLKGLIASRFDIIDKLGKTYYERENSASQQAAMFHEVKQIITDFAENNELLQELELIVNTCHDNAMEKLRNDFPSMKEAHYLLLAEEANFQYKTLTEHMEGQRNAESHLKGLIASRFDIIDKLGKTYYERENSASQQAAMFHEVKQIITDFAENNELLQELELIVNTCHDNAMEKLRNDFPSMKEADIRLLCYIFVGFSPQVISLFMKDTVANVYARKSRLKSRIKSAETANKELFLALFG